ncbi:MAG: hypothetical protein JWR21_3385 [Herminiimonas sp.]|nr:hypothetical protein [Herminiimonas sp.]
MGRWGRGKGGLRGNLAWWFVLPLGLRLLFVEPERQMRAPLLGFAFGAQYGFPAG